MKRETATLNFVDSYEDRPSVAVVDGNNKLRTRLAMQLSEAVAAASFATVEAMEDKVDPGTPLIVVFGPSYATSKGLKEVQGLTRRHPEVASIMVVDELTTQMLQQALRAGVRDVVAAPADGTQLLEAVERASETLSLVPTTPVRADGSAQEGRLISVFSTKGGAGKSVVASNLAVILARKTSAPVALVDADLQFGDVAVMMKLTPQHTIVDAVAAIQRLDPQLLQSLLVRHDPSGLYVLPAPVEPAFADQVSGADMVRIVKILQSFCAYVVIDTPAHFNDVVLALLEESDDILLISGMDIPNIKNVKLGLQTLRLLNIPVSKLKLVLNRSNSKVKLDIGEVERTLQMKADVLIPSDILVPQSVNKGVPAVIDAPKSGVSRSLEQLASLFVDSNQRRTRR
ncbi:MAG: response regulator [Actinobacteria bacterium]|nr:MAG: response regulator [Actinomycetota bacterium]